MKIPKMKISGLIACLLFFLILCSPTYAISVRDLGQPTGHVNDYAGILNSPEKARLEAICLELVEANTSEIAIVTITSLEGRTVEELAQEIFQTWGIGTKSNDNGVLILIALDDREWRVHTGYGVEGVLTDNLARRIMETELVPEFRAGNYGQGLINATTQIKLVLEGEEYTGDAFPWMVFPIIFGVIGTIIALIWLSVRVTCPRCGSRVNLEESKEVLAATYSHSGIRKKVYSCTVCHNKFSRMTILPMLVQSSSSGSSSSRGWSSGGWSSGGSSFGGFSGGSSGGGGASGGW